MTVGENLTEFAGRKVEDYDPKVGIKDPTNTSYRVRTDWDTYDKGGSFEEVMAKFLADPNLSQVKSFVIGMWSPESDGDSADVVRLIANETERLKQLEALFFGDITFEENEISWIQQCDITPLFDALPNLKILRVRGSDGLAVASVAHSNLREIAFESGGLRSNVISAVLESDFPALEHLEFWLGDSGYGWDGSVKLFSDLFAGKLFPALKYLGLRDSEIADNIADVIANAPILERIDTLDLSMGTLSDRGADALLKSPHIGNLKRLDIHHHYVSNEKTQALAQKVAEFNADDKQEADEDDGEQYRYVAVSE